MSQTSVGLRTARQRATFASLLLLIGSSALGTEGYFAHGWGTISKALAGADQAHPKSALSGAQNPASIAYVGSQVEVAASLFAPYRRYSASPGVAGTFWPGGDDTQSGRNEFLIPTLGATMALRDGKSSVGLMIYGNGGMNTSYPATANGGAGVFGAGKAGVNLEQLFVAPTYARKLSEKTSAGIALIFAHQKFSANGLAAFGSMVADGVPDNLTDRGDDGSDGIGLRVGVHSEVAPGLSVAASYEPKIKMSRFDKYSDLFAQRGRFDIPENFSVGVAYSKDPKSSTVFEVRHILYSNVPSVGNPMQNLFDGMGSVPPDPSKFLGGSQGVGFGWRDVTAFKLGHEWQAAQGTTLRAGVSYCRQPIASTEALFNILAPGVQEWQFTAGFTKEMKRDQALHFAAMYSPAKTVTGPNPFAPAQTIRLKMYEFDLEVGYSWKF